MKGFTQDITVEDLVRLNKSTGMVVEINDGQITSIKFEEVL